MTTEISCRNIPWCRCGRCHVVVPDGEREAWMRAINRHLQEQAERGEKR